MFCIAFIALSEAMSMVVETPASIRDKTDHLKINDAAKMQYLFWDRGSTLFKMPGRDGGISSTISKSFVSIQHVKPYRF